jgi:hypothetical protein
VQLHFRPEVGQMPSPSRDANCQRASRIEAEKPDPWVSASHVHIRTHVRLAKG